MGIFGKKEKSTDELESERDRLVIEEEIASHSSNIAERRALEARAKREHGPGWRKILGVVGKIDIQTLRSMLGSANAGLRGQGGALYNPKLDPRPRMRQ